MSVAYLKQQINDLQEANVKLQNEIEELKSKEGKFNLLQNDKDHWKKKYFDLKEENENSIQG